MKKFLMVLILLFFLGVPLVCLFLPVHIGIYVMQAYILISFFAYFINMFFNSKDSSSQEEESPLS